MAFKYNQKQEEPECTRCPNNDGTTDVQSDDCVSKWKTSLPDAKGLYLVSVAAATKAEERYTNEFAWKNKLDIWFNNVEIVKEKHENLLQELVAFFNQISIVCEKGEATKNALEILLHQAECIFKDVYELLKEGQEKEDYGLIQALLMEVNCTDELQGAEKTKILGAIDAYKTKVNAVYALQENTLIKLLTAYQAMQLLYNTICSDTGIKSQVDILCSRLDGSLSSIDKTSTFPCGDSISMPKLFRIHQSDYYIKTGNQLSAAKVKLEGDGTDANKGLKKEWEDARKERDKNAAQYNSIVEAIKAAEAAESAK